MAYSPENETPKAKGQAKPQTGAPFALPFRPATIAPGAKDQPTDDLKEKDKAALAKTNMLTEFKRSDEKFRKSLEIRKLPENWLDEFRRHAAHPDLAMHEKIFKDHLDATKYRRALERYDPKRRLSNPFVNRSCLSSSRLLLIVLIVRF
ncbi:unnamed protein product [Periconia digitata]|uniref:Uncharacterized protein n=1 Tax=Periconia digitata TaxID=1303443 RepID=A0A9W4XML3_9PLEO|nr:unnamed protein product [Periconia digitata]